MGHQKITINPIGGAIQMSVTFTGNNVVISYRWNLLETKVNGKFYPNETTGTNLNPFDDSYTLPTPIADNVGRMIVVDYGVVVIDPKVKSRNYSITVEVVQGGNSLGNVTDNGAVTGNSASGSIYVPLI